MRTNKFLAAVLLVGVAFSALTSCEKEPTQNIEGLNAVTYQTSYNNYGVWRQEISEIYFYSDIFPMRSLLGSKVTINFTSDNVFRLYQAKDTTFNKCTSIMLTGDYLFFDVYSKVAAGLNFPNSSEKSVAFMLLYFLPQSGDYEFSLQIENPEQGIYYRTPIYRYTISEDESNKDWFRTSIVQL